MSNNFTGSTQNQVTLHFLGGAGTVTGSKYLIESGGTRVLIDCGLFQGLKELRLKNWEKFPVDPRTIDAIVLTHAHLDHSGYIPRLVTQGFEGEIFATEPTRDLSGILLSDSGYIQEEEARYSNRKGFSKHHPAKPLYTQAEAESSLHFFKVKALSERWRVGDIEFEYCEAGHILGAASVVVKASGKRIIFSGDIGRFNDVLMTSPVPCAQCDYVVMESTYGDRGHKDQDLSGFVQKLLKQVQRDRSVLLIPAFAVGRAQTLLYLLYRIFQSDPSLRVPLFINSPMATDVTTLFLNHSDEHKLTADEFAEVQKIAKFVRTPEESIELNRKRGPMVIISASGMLTGGRILHHIRAFAGDPKTVILLVGYQAAGTRGHTLFSGTRELKIHGEYVPIMAQVYQIDGLSAHADQKDLMRWLGSSCTDSFRPQKIFLVHGEASALDALRLKVKDTLGLNVEIPHLGQAYQL